MIVAGRVVRVEAGSADVVLIQPSRREEEKAGCGKCGGETRCPIPMQTTLRALPAPRPLAPGADIEVEVLEASREYAGGRWGATLLVGLAAALAALGLTQMLAQQVFRSPLSAPPLFSLAALCGALAAGLFAWGRRRRARWARISARIL